ncbi:probable protein S-acyltransferase 12 isoform X1 [Aegilops tauschii subsp. strangulata]|uniref:S-acyltransferase n=1 Tax=Aegilops tauschii subsp. strangulata TaxID=200361 RepID=A0A453B7U0_AEGTS|nr:probable protein S-acyltransferase 12 isoform X1 [Aegilops tauschii subsp. strangulata]
MECLRRVNPFRACAGLRVLGYLMLALVAAIVAASYYAVVVYAWGPLLLRGGNGGTVAAAAFVLAAFHLLLIMMLWCYFMVVFTNPGAVPENWRHAAEGDEEQGHAPRYCSRCQNGKPPRCHHCSICDRCVLKMDHHCVWVVNCVGARNYKYFLLFLVYTFLETVLDTLVLLPSFIIFFHDGSRRPSSAGDIAILFLAFVLNLAFALSLLCFICMHTSLAASNTTSIEVYERKKTCSWEYDLGWRKNLEQVFGTNKLLWFLPMYCTEDLQNIPTIQGLEFPTRSDAVL